MQLTDNYSLEFNHRVNALFSLAAFYFIFQTTYLITKNIWISTISFLLLLCFPRFYGDIFTNSKDIGPAWILLGSLYYSVRYFFGKRALSTHLLLGIFFAIGASLRPVLMYAFGLFLFFSFLQTMHKKLSMKKYLINQGILSLTVLIVFFLASPYYLSYSGNVFQILSLLKQYPWDNIILFEGNILRYDQLPWYYLPKWILMSTLLITLGLFIVGNLFCYLYFFKSNSAKKYVYAYLLSLFWVPVLVVSCLDVVIYDGWRQFLFLSGPLILLASLGVHELMQSKNKIIIWASIILLGANIILTAREMMLLHPYEYIYFNSLVGGLQGAYGKYELDYWGASYKEATEWIVANKSSLLNGNLYVFPRVWHLASPYIESITSGAIIDYEKATISYSNVGAYYMPEQSSGTILHIVERKGVPLNVIAEDTSGKPFFYSVDEGR